MVFKQYLSGKIEKIDGYRAVGGLRGLQRVERMKGEAIVEEIKRSQLRGRGGAGFPTGLKLEMAANADDKEKYVICNADEGEVGTFKDRELLRKCPYVVLEGLIIVGMAIGARTGYIYLRNEYSYLIEDLKRTIREMNGEVAHARGKSFTMHLRIGAGAYVCGEETSLIESMEQKRGEPRLKPPYPTESGLFNKPTAIINVETLANLSWIFAHGAEAFNKIGTEMSKGTKLFSVSGDVKRPGVYELPMGAKLRELVEDRAGAEDVKAIQLGGASGRIIAGNDLDRTLCFEDVLGAGGVLVFDSSRNMVEAMRETMAFFMDESCGKCAPCREGSFVIHGILERIGRGDGKLRDLSLIREIADSMKDTSFCGLGISAPNSLLDSMDLFGAEFEHAVTDKEELGSAV